MRGGVCRRVFGLAIITLALADAPASAQPPGDAAVATALLPSGQLTVAVSLAGAGPYRFIVDTGAERTVIARELADRLGLHAAGKSGLLSLTSSREVAKVDVPDLSFVPGETRHLQAFALAGENIGASGILGIDALRGQKVVLDFKAGTLTVGPAPQHEEKAEADTIVVHARRRFGQLVFEQSNVDGIAVDVVIDSGSQVSIGNDALRRVLAARRLSTTIQPIMLVSVTGEALSADYTRADRFVIGSAAVSGLPIAFADAHVFARLKLVHQPALLLGSDALQLFSRVSVDFLNKSAQFVLPDNVARIRE